MLYGAGINQPQDCVAEGRVGRVDYVEGRRVMTIREALRRFVAWMESYPHQFPAKEKGESEEVCEPEGEDTIWVSQDLGPWAKPEDEEPSGDGFFLFWRRCPSQSRPGVFRGHRGARENYRGSNCSWERPDLWVEGGTCVTLEVAKAQGAQADAREHMSAENASKSPEGMHTKDEELSA